MIFNGDKSFQEDAVYRKWIVNCYLSSVHTLICMIAVTINESNHRHLIQLSSGLHSCSIFWHSMCHDRCHDRYTHVLCTVVCTCTYTHVHTGQQTRTERDVSSPRVQQNLHLIYFSILAMMGKHETWQSNGDVNADIKRFNNCCFIHRGEDYSLGTESRSYCIVQFVSSLGR